MIVKYNLSKEARDSAFVETGIRPPQEGATEIAPTELSREVRALIAPLATADGLNLVRTQKGHYVYLPFAPNAGNLPEVLKIYQGWDSVVEEQRKVQEAKDEEARRVRILNDRKRSFLWSVERLPEMESQVGSGKPAFLVPENAPEDLVAAFPELADLNNRLERLRIANTPLLDEHARQQELARQQEAEEAERRKAQKIVFEAEKTRWVAAFGSDSLKGKTAAGYNCNSQYLKERVAAELPAPFIVPQDWDDLEQLPRSCPSDAAWEIEEAINFPDTVDPVTGATRKARVVWIKEKDRYGETFGYEAVLLDDYLGHWDLLYRVP